jgi:plasmid stabilization system protein ParE
LILTPVVRIKPRARREINEAAAWWSENRPAAPGAVSHDLQEALELLVEFPGIGTKVENTKSPEVRRWLLSRVGHHMYYRVRGDYFEVIAFWSTSREHEPRV